ncbi:MAG: glycosyltransferase [Ruminococcaceae bacterium]|nr:glycosyltransferase [Oscillospiraceae bacterium]
MEKPHFQPLCYSDAPVPDMNETPLVSVIVPVYNVEKYLSACLDSVINQTLKNIEVICIDDGSTDHSGEILAAYRNHDARIQIISQINAGPSVARNVGLQSALGEFVFFLDADDVLALDALETCCKVSRTNDLDILYFDFDRFYDDGTRGKRFERKAKLLIYDGVSFCKMLKDRREYLGVVWSQLYKREFITASGLSFYPGIIHEDELFSFQALMAAKRVSSIPRVLYHHLVRENSIMTAEKSYKNVEGYFACMCELLISGLQETQDEEKRAEIYRAFKGMQEQVKRHYNMISNLKKDEITLNNAFSFTLFEALVIGNTAAQMPVTTQETASRDQVLALVNKTLTQELAEIRSSAAYKIGRIITWFPRKIQGFLQCYREHGAGYTWERFLVHLHLREDDSDVDSKPKNRRRRR